MLTFVLDPEMAVEIQEEKKQLVGQILDLQNTLDGESQNSRQSVNLDF